MLIKGIKSFSDVITNSSSEVYVMHESDASYYNNLENTNDCIDIEKIDWDWVKTEGLYELEMICDLCELDKSLLNYTNDYGEYVDYTIDEMYYNLPYPCMEDWLTFIDINYKVIEEKLINKNYYWVDIEDHFENAYDVSHSARGDSVWTDYRH